MTELLIGLFIKDKDNIGDSAVRGSYGTMAGVVGIVCNVVLFLGKLFIGLVSRSVSITADAVNNLADASSSVMTLLGFRLAKRPADEEHPYGHARFEYLSGLGVAALILIIGVQIGIQSVEKIISPEPVIFSTALVVVLLLSIVVKLWMAGFNWKLGKKINSATLKATAIDSRNDVVSTGAVLISAVVAYSLDVTIDGYVGVLVALFILKSGAELAKETISPLLGEPADPEIVAMIRGETMSFSPLILGMHDLMVHDYGPNQRFATLHAEISYKEDVRVAHEVLDDLERYFHEKHKIQLVIHYDPIVTDDEELNEAKLKMMYILRGYDERLSAHDFRMVRGEGHCNLIFDVVLPYDLSKEEKTVFALLDQGAKKLNENYNLVIDFDYAGAKPK